MLIVSLRGPALARALGESMVTLCRRRGGKLLGAGTLRLWLIAPITPCSFARYGID